MATDVRSTPTVPVHEPRRAQPRACQAAVVAIFLLAIGLPPIANLAGVDGGDAGAENRELAPFPRLDASPGGIARFGNGLSDWFSDHFGFRAQLVRWYGESRLRVLGVSPTSSVVLGRDGWFFYGDDKSLDDYAQVDPFTPDAIANWRTAIVKTRMWLASKGIAYVFTIAPDKYVLYPEHMPAALARVGERSRSDELFTALQDTGVAVDVRQALAGARSRERLYEKTDTHWNDRGAFVAYQQIIEAVRQRVPSVPPAWTRDEFEPVARRVEAGDLAGMMGLKRVMSEIDLELVPTRPRRARVVEPAGAAPTAEEGYLVTEIPGSTLPRAVIFRDSFVSRLAPFLSEHFSRAVYLWQNDFDPSVVVREHPDVVIQEIVGRHLYNFIPSPELVPDPSPGH